MLVCAKRYLEQSASIRVHHFKWHFLVKLGLWVAALIMAALRRRCGHYIFALWFLSFFFPRLISSVADWMSTILQHMMWPECEFRMYV